MNKKLAIIFFAIVMYAVIMVQMGWYRELSPESIAATMILIVVIFGIERILFLLGFGLLFLLLQFFFDNMSTF
jgi:hypothetical protein